jgi:hypothetical protein
MKAHARNIVASAVAKAVTAKRYTASPTLSRFHNDPSFLKYVEGPVGSGKSTGGVMEVMMRAFRQAPDEHRIRRSRWAIVRNTYPELKSTTIKTWEMWVPEHVAPVVYGSPITCHFKQKLDDGTMVDLEVYFLALDSAEDVTKLLSLELTGAYINEGREVVWEIVEAMMGRVDRFPQIIEMDDGSKGGGATEPGIIVDSNPPNMKHWLYQKFETGAVPEGWRKFQQPPAVFWVEETQGWALNPDAENLAFLPTDYYKRQMNGAEETYIRVMLAGEYGATRKGRPIFTLYSEQKHVSKEIIVPERRWPLIVGLDFGLFPGCVIGQLTHRGIRITDEIPVSDESLEDFLETYLQPLLAKRYPGFQIIGSGDPAGTGRSGNDKRTSFDVLAQFGIKAFPAFSNNFQTRKEAVDHFLRRDEGLVISPHCTTLREALGTGYIWKEARNASGASVDKADKNDFSHIADALQYLCMWCRYGYRPEPIRDKGPAKKTMWC